MTNLELITIGYQFVEKYLPHGIDVYIDSSYLEEIEAYNYKNIYNAIEEFKFITSKYEAVAAELPVIDCIYYYYFKDNFVGNTDFQLKNAFKLGRFLWYISIEKDEFLEDIEKVLKIYL